MWTTRVFSGDSRSPIGASTVATSVAQRLGVFPLAGDEDDEVVGVADESVVRQAMAAAFLSLLLDGHRRLPLPGEVIIQHGQGDVGQQRGEDPALRGAGDACLPGCRWSVRTPALRKAFTNARTRLSSIRVRRRSIKAV